MVATVDATPLPAVEDDQAVMVAYSIERVPVDSFHWKNDRTSTLKDAVAAAKRAQTSKSGLA